MKIRDFIWLETVEEKIVRKHHVQPYEVQEVFYYQPLFRFMERGERHGEDVYAVHGQTHSGRYLIVFFIHKTTGDALIISARDMTTQEQKYYEKHV